MKQYLTALTLATLALAACDSDRSPTGPGSEGFTPSVGAGQINGDQGDGGAVYALTNAIDGNAVAVFTRDADGLLSPAGTFATGGTGTGGGIGSQGALALSTGAQWLLAVNPGSNDVSVFRVGASALTLASRTPSGGTLPISVAISGNVVYVLNAGGSGNISGFTLDDGGTLAPIPGSIRGLSGEDVRPAQISFAPGGHQLFVAEKATDLLDVYPVDAYGVAGIATLVNSAGGTPFGFAFGPRGILFVSEAAGAGSASSYRLGAGQVRVVSGAVPTNQGAPCWAVITNDGRFGYTGNGAGSVSGFSIAPDGALRLLDIDGATAVVNGGVNDIALDRDSRYLYVLQVGAAPVVHAYRIERDGHLQALGQAAGLPASTRGLVAR